MEFERARTKEQKDIRVMEILKAAMKQYGEMPYDKITLASISGELNFSRVNLYKYFNTKEEIFLKIIELDIYKMSDRLNLIFKGQPSKNLKSFAVKWSNALFSQGRVLELLSRLYTGLEKNASAEKLAEFKSCYFSMENEFAAILKEQMPYLKSAQINNFIAAHNTFIMGLYPMCKFTETQKKAAEIAGRKASPADFISTLSDFIITYISGLRA